jgi:hypothetical protein
MFFNWIIFLWWLSFGVSIYTFVYGVAGRSWIYMLISMLTFLPISYFLFSFDNSLKYIAYLPLVPLLFGILFWFKWNKRRKDSVSTNTDHSLSI